MDDPCIKLSTLMKLPPRCSVVGMEDIIDMSRNKRKALLVFWTERHGTYFENRKAHFCSENGDYLGEA